MSEKERNKTKYLFTVTTFGVDADRIATPLVLANNALSMGNDVLLWLTLDGVELAKTGAAESLVPKSFPRVQELLDTYLENGGRIGVCPPCAKAHGVTEDNLVENAAWMGGAAVIEAAAGRQTFSF
jgi:predicted peroxiredoxin